MPPRGVASWRRVPFGMLASRGTRAAAPVGMVAPYATPGESDRHYAGRVNELASRGYTGIKLYPLADPDAMTRCLAAIRDRIGGSVDLVVDMA